MKRCEIRDARREIRETRDASAHLPEVHLDGRVKLLKACLEQKLKRHRVLEADRVGLVLVPV